MAHETEKIYTNIVETAMLLHIDAMQTHHSKLLQISRHAIERYQQRVSFIPPAAAAERLAELATNSARRPTPRRWTNVLPGPGVLFLYPRANSAICLLLKNDTIITVFSRDVCREWRGKQMSGGARVRGGARGSLHRPPYRRPSPGLFPLEAA